MSEVDGSGPASGIDEAPERSPRNPLTWVMLGLVRGYQLIVSPWLPPSCKYYPSCSAYAVTALRRHGVVRGLGLAGWRLLRCNPWSHGGVDHVPLRPAARRGPMLVHDDDARTLVSGSGDRSPDAAHSRGARTSAPQDL